MRRPPPDRAPGPTPARPAPLPEDLESAEIAIDGVVYRVLSHPIESGASTEGGPVPSFGGLAGVDLTAAERDIVARILAGSSHADIARSRGTSPRTVSKQVEALYRKVGVQSRAQLVARLAGR